MQCILVLVDSRQFLLSPVSFAMLMHSRDIEGFAATVLSIF